MKTAIYCRLSEEDRCKQTASDESESIQNQKSILIEYANERQWEIYDIYIDDNYTGSDRTRPAFNRLLSDAEKNKFDIILCKSLSRFTRELEIIEKYIHGLFELWKIRFVSIVDNADTQIKGNKKARQINGLINEWYLEDMSENIKSVLTNKRKQGLHIGSFPLYGYLKDPNKKGGLIVDEEAAEVVREVFRLYSQGYGKSAIARILNDKGVPNPTEYKRLKAITYKTPKTKSGTLWKYFAIADMLTNEIYIGNMVQGKYGSISYKSKVNKPLPKEKWIVVEGTHEPIIDRELWDDVQSKVRANFKPFGSGKIGLFAKKAKCMNCGYVLSTSKSRGEYYLKCSTKHIAKNACVGSFISVKLLSQAIVGELSRMMADYLDKDELSKKVCFENNNAVKKEKLKKELYFYEKKSAEYSKAIKELYLDKVKGIISNEDFLEFSKDFYKEKDLAEKSASQAQKQMADLEEQLQTVTDKTYLIEQYTTITELNRIIIEKLVNCIYIGRKDLQTKTLPLEIHWLI